MSSMAEFLASKKLANQVVMVNCSRCPEVAALGARFQHLANENNNFTVKTVYSAGGLGDAEGYLTKELLEAYVGNTAIAHYYFCGPPVVMVGVCKALEDLGVPAEQIHYEFFGPHDSR